MKYHKNRLKTYAKSKVSEKFDPEQVQRFIRKSITTAHILKLRVLNLKAFKMPLPQKQNLQISIRK